MTCSEVFNIAYLVMDIVFLWGTYRYNPLRVHGDDEVRRGVIVWCGVCFAIVSEDILPC